VWVVRDPRNQGERPLSFIEVDPLFGKSASHPCISILCDRGPHTHLCQLIQDGLQGVVVHLASQRGNQGGGLVGRVGCEGSWKFISSQPGIISSHCLPNSAFSTVVSSGWVSNRAAMECRLSSCL
jgi:hypothetical protein